MGIPKFFRTMSERYPLISQLVEENKIPEFDNLYLDMNGIIHNCSHPNDGDAHFRISEADMFLAIFSYIEHIFAKIKPQKLFFLAIDGVAPRAKMNQQRSRRFRTAQEAKEIKERAERRGEELPEEEAFDSNCITPGTPFMAKLSQQLVYFLTKKVTEDAQWHGVEVVLSGHDVPGEGEHKIMEYIRHAKAQPGYNRNVRHCLYGLDADLIMLGLLSHDPHFALLREEVNFGPSRHKKKGGLESQNFYLLHLSLFREYLDLEFQELKTTLPFEYSLERVIDDFVLLNIFVGNDFLPHLPGMHINEGALGLLFRIYMKVLPKAGGYINEDGNLRTDRLSLVLTELTHFEREQLEEELADAAWQHSKQSKSNKAKAKAKTNLVLTAQQRIMFEQVRQFILNMRNARESSPTELFLPGTTNAADRKFLGRMITDLGLDISFDEYDPEADAPAIAISRRAPLEGDDEDDEDDEESRKAVNRVLNKYENAKTEDASDDTADEEEEYNRLLKEKHDQIKREYYKEKMHLNFDDKEQMQTLAYRYIEGLQWVLHYYYDGVASWGWFYDYHYAPMISDLTAVTEMTFDFDLGKPFRPFDQLMGVLPSLSAQHIPEAFRDLMTDPASPIIDFYPSRFEADFNGKKQSWEAVVKIPFIEEKRLLAALDKREGLLTADEKKRNSFGTSVRVTYDDTRDVFFPSSLPGIFPDILHCKANLEPFNLPTLDGLHLIKGLCDGVGLGVNALAGFPSIKTLPHYGRTARHGVSVFQSESRNESVVISIENTFEQSNCEAVAAEYIGKRTFVNWPFLTEGIVTAVSSAADRFEAKLGKNGTSTIFRTPLESFEVGEWKRKAANIERLYSKRYGVLIGNVDIVLHVRPLKGLTRMQDGSFLKDYEVNAKNEIDQAIQVSVANVLNEDSRYLERPPLPLPLEFPERSRVFYLGTHAYGSPASVLAVSKKEIAIELISLGNQAKENELLAKLVNSRVPEKYFAAYEVCKQLRISGLALSKITSSMLVDCDDSRLNIGLNLKFEAKGQKVLGYTRRSAAGWEYSEKTLAILREYQTRFPEVSQTLMNNAGKDVRDMRIIFGDRASAKMAEMKSWLKSTGVRDLEAVPLFAEQLDTSTVQAIERFVAQLAAHNADKIRRVALRKIPRSALLKPSHAPYRLTSQKFALGDRVVCVSDSGIVPISSRGVVVGINPANLDVVFDAPFLAGGTLDDRCGAYKGATVPFNALLNISHPQFVCTETMPAAGEAAASEAASNGQPKSGIAAHKSALERTLALESATVTNGTKPGDATNGKNGAGHGPASYRPPSHFRPARQPTGAPSIGSRGFRSGEGAPRVDNTASFSHVTSGQVRPRPPQSRNGGAGGADALNPHLAALNLGTRGHPGAGRGRGNGQTATNGHTVPTGPRGGGRGGHYGRGQ